MVARIARGVHAAHMAGLVHCDLKPNNIVVTADGEPKVTDFGVAIRADDQQRARSGPAEPVGNLAFTSPEQYRMEPGALTIPTDVYALGGILYWLLTGLLPNGATPEAIRHTHDPIEGRAVPPAVRAQRPQVDRDLELICQRAMARRPDQRFASAAEVAESLEAWLRREPLGWTRTSLPRRLRLWTRRKRPVAIAVAVVAILLLASGVTLGRLASVASQKRVEAIVAQAGLEQAAEYRRQYQAKLTRIRTRLEGEASKGIAHKILPQIWILEWMYGPNVLGEGPERFDLWDLRLVVVHDLVDRAWREGRGADLHTLIWETALGFWLIHDVHDTEAESVLADNLRGWRARLDPSDPFLLHVHALQVCATVGRYAGCDQDTRPPTPMPGDLEAAAAKLEEAEHSLGDLAWGTPMHHIVLFHLLMLYRPEMLDRPGRLAELTETFARVIK